MTLLRIQLRRTKGWRMPPNTVRVDRASDWGNPFRIDEPPHAGLLRKWGWKLANWTEACGSPEEVCRRFRACFAGDEASHAAARSELRGKNLACWCRLCPAHADGKPLGRPCPNCAPCHADTLGELANRP